MKTKKEKEEEKEKEKEKEEEEEKNRKGGNSCRVNLKRSRRQMAGERSEKYDPVALFFKYILPH